MKRFYISSLLCLFALTSFANEEENYIPGQVVRSDGSRISTLVKIPVDAEEKTVQIMDAETGQGSSLHSNEIRSITVVVDGKTVQYIHTNYTTTQNKSTGKSVWLKTLSWGEILLYSGTWNNRTVYFIKGPGEEIPTQITEGNYKLKLIPIISDHRYLTRDLEKGTIGYNQLATLLDEYNAWKSFE